jgi:hypothetical protein
MYFYPVYRYNSSSYGTFARVGSMLGYKGPPGCRTYTALLQEAKKLFAAGIEDVILLGPLPIASYARASSPSETNSEIVFSGRQELFEREENGINCS